MTDQRIKPEFERMSDFFAARVDTYDSHMLTGVKCCQEACRKLAELVPADAAEILELGCGTGLELEEIFRRLPDVSVLGVDFTQAMLDRLKPKYPDRNIRLICGNYFEIDFGISAFDAASTACAARTR